ncbi:hypothetical protein ACSQ76_22650 [Roseovarius sp. B08]
MMMGCCTGRGMFFGLLGMVTPVIAIGAILYLVFAKRQTPKMRESH